MAHIMLPGEPKYGNNSNDPRYSIPAIEKIEKELNKSGSSLALSKIALIGGANVLRKEIDELTPLIISSTQDKLFRMGGKIHFQDTGGFLRRSVWVEIPTGLINYSTGNDIQKKTLYL